MRLLFTFIFLLFCCCSFYNPFTPTTYREENISKKKINPTPIPTVIPNIVSSGNTPIPLPISTPIPTSIILHTINSISPISGSTCPQNINIKIIFNCSLNSNLIGKIMLLKKDESDMLFCLDENNANFQFETTNIFNDTIIINPNNNLGIAKYTELKIENFQDINNNNIEKIIIVSYFFDII
jgi:hypothetical protein